MAVQRLGGVQEQRCPLLVDDEIGLCDRAAVAQVHGRVSERRELRATRVDVGAPVKECGIL